MGLLDMAQCTSGGCGAKMGPDELAGYLRALPTVDDPRLLVGFAAADDAGVFQASPELAVISTADFFPPMVDEPFLFGRIAAANALSDIYAMGGQPIMALNLVAFPQSADREILAEIMRGGAETLREAGVALAGGHSIYDPQPKYGLSVTGLARPDRILRNNTCREGDCLVLTKPLGVGLILSASRVGLAEAEAYDAAVAAMTRLNKYAAEKLPPFPVSACTDVTGFGLLAHAAEMAGADRTLVIDADSLPLLPRAREYAAEFMATAAGQRNRNHLAGTADVRGIDAALQEALFDPQTSGGLLISVPCSHAEALLAALRRDDPAAAVIGQVEARGKNAVVAV